MFEVASSKFTGIQQLTKLHTDYMCVLPVLHAAGAHARAQCRATRWAPVVGSYVVFVRLSHSCGNLQVLLLPPPYLRCDGHYEEPVQASGRRRQGGVCGGLDSLCWVLFFPMDHCAMTGARRRLRCAIPRVCGGSLPRACSPDMFVRVSGPRSSPDHSSCR